MSQSPDKSITRSPARIAAVDTFVRRYFPDFAQECVTTDPNDLLIKLVSPLAARGESRFPLAPVA